MLATAKSEPFKGWSTPSTRGTQYPIANSCSFQLEGTYSPKRVYATIETTLRSWRQTEDPQGNKVSRPARVIRFGALTVSSNKRRGTTFQWAADRNQILPPGAFPSRGGTGPTRIMAGSTRLANGTPGVDIRDRLTLSTGNSLGIRSHMDHSMLSNRSDSAGRSFDPWTTSQPSYDSHPAYTTPMPSYHQANPTFSMPPTTTSSYELHSGYAPYSDITYQTPRHSMPPANYNTSSNIHPQSDQDHLAGNDHSYFSGSNAYSQMHSGGAMDGFDHHETGHVPDFPASFTNSTSMASNGPDQDFSFAGMGEGPKSHQNGHYMDSGDPFQ